MFHRFKFEAEFYQTMERIPFHVRMKLDITGGKLSLATWRAFGLEERWVLCHLPVETDEERRIFTAYLRWLSGTRASVELARVPVLEPSTWGDNEVPEAVKTRSKANGTPVTTEQWRRWADHERYALYKTAMSRDSELFKEALQELSDGRRESEP